MHTKLGRIHVPETPEALLRLHFHRGQPLHVVDHEPKVAVLDQEDLLAQGIRCSTFIPGAGDPDALGSCTCNTLIEAFSNVLPERQFAGLVYGPNQGTYAAGVYQDTKHCEEAAIACYHAVTDQTGTRSQEWPPTDCGSSGPYLYEWALHQKLIRGERIANGAQSVVSLMQTDGVLVGMPWFQGGFEPDHAGFIDGNGSASAIEALIRTGVAGGHEIYGAAIEKLTLTGTGHVDPFGTVIRFRNHWTASFGDHGSFRAHLSLLVALGSNADIRQFYL